MDLEQDDLLLTDLVPLILKNQYDMNVVVKNSWEHMKYLSGKGTHPRIHKPNYFDELP